MIDGRDVEEGGARLRYFILDSELHGEEFGRVFLEIERAVSFCDARDYGRTFLWTVDELEAAIPLYRDVGFVPTEWTSTRIGGRTSLPVVRANPPRAMNAGMAAGCTVSTGRCRRSPSGFSPSDTSPAIPIADEERRARAHRGYRVSASVPAETADPSSGALASKPTPRRSVANRSHRSP